MKPEGSLFPYNESGYGANEDYFGKRISLDGNFMVIVSPETKLGNNNNYSSGVVHIYKNNNNEWSLFQVLTKPSELPYSSLFAQKAIILNGKIYVSISGTIFPSGKRAGILVFQMTNNQWKYETSIEQPTDELNQFFAHDFSIHGDKLVASNTRTTINGVQNAGSAFIFEFISTSQSWEFIKEIHAENPVENEFFGSQLDFDEGHVVVSAEYFPNLRNKSFIFEENNGVWSNGVEFPFDLTQNFVLNTIDLNQNNALALTDIGPGIFIKSNGQWALAQQLEHPSIDLSQTVHVYIEDNVLICTIYDGQFKSFIFKEVNNQWQYYQSMEPLSASSYDISIEYKNNNIVFGDFTLRDNQNLILRGRVYIYEDDGNSFTNGITIIPERGGYREKLGSNVWMDGHTALVKYNNGLHEFEWSNGSWSHVMPVDILPRKAEFKEGYFVTSNLKPTYCPLFYLFGLCCSLIHFFLKHF